MVILGITSYGFTFVGSIAFMQFSLYAYQVGKPEDRPASYFRGRMGLYCGMLVLAGISQLLLGAELTKKYGGGSLTRGPIGGAMYVVTFPVISIVVGFVQIVNGIWGIARSCGFYIISWEGDYIYQAAICFGWILQLALQIFVQVGYIPGNLLAASPAVTATVSFGLSLMPAYLDYRTRNTPEALEKEHYGEMDVAKDMSSEEMKGYGADQSQPAIEYSA